MTLRFVLLNLMALTAIFVPPVFAYDIEYEAGLRIEFHDNANQFVANSGSDIALLPYAGLSLLHEGERLVASVESKLEFERYQDSTFQNDTRLTADAYLGFSIIPGRLVWNVQDTATIEKINALGFDLPNNTQRVNVLATGPELYFDSDAWRVVLKAQASQVSYEESGEFDGAGLALSGSLVRDINSYSSLGLSVSYYDSEYDELSTLQILDPANFGTNNTSTVTFVQSNYDVIRYYLDYSRELPYGRLVAKGGYNSLSTDAQDFDEPYYDVRLNYYDGGNLRGGVTLRSELADPVIRSFNPSFSRLSAFASGLQPPSQLGINANPSYYQVDELAGELRYDVGRYQTAVRVFSQESDYFSIEPSDEQFGQQLDVIMELNSRSQLNFSLANREVEYPALDITDETLEYEVSYGYELFEGITLAGGYGYVDRSSNLNGRGADDSIVFFEINYTGGDTGEDF